MPEDIISIVDALLMPVYLLIFFAVVFFIKNRNVGKHSYYTFFVKGFFLKVLGGVAFALIYIYYYGGGDTIYYFDGGNILIDQLFQQPVNYFRFMSSSASNLAPDLQYIKYMTPYARSNEEWFMLKIMSVVNFLSFRRYLVSTIFLSFISFAGSWRMYQAFLYFFPKQKRLIFYAVFLSPSLVFWGSGIVKDTVTLASLGFFLYTGVMLLFNYRFSLYKLGVFIFSFYVIFELKSYIIVAFLPLLLIAWFLHNREKITNAILRNVLTPVVMVLPIVVSLFSVSALTEMSAKYKLEDLEWRVRGFHTWHSSEGAGGSSYDLHVTDYSPMGIASKIPEALSVTYFQPFLWKAHSFNMLLTGFEGLIYLCLFIYVLLKYRLKLFWYALQNPFLFLSLFYAILFGFAVGFTSYNFGALARYKIPALPFALFFLLFFAFNKKKYVLHQIHYKRLF